MIVHTGTFKGQDTSDSLGMNIKFNIHYWKSSEEENPYCNADRGYNYVLKAMRSYLSQGFVEANQVL